LVKELRTEESEAASSPVAVESWLEMEAMALPASEVKEEICEDASSVMDETTEAMDEVWLARSEAMEVATEVAESSAFVVEVVSTTVWVWAAAREAKTARTVAQRILKVGGWFVWLEVRGWRLEVGVREVKEKRLLDDCE